MTPKVCPLGHVEVTPVRGAYRWSAEPMVSRVTDHTCPVSASTGDLIDRSWCFDRFAHVLSKLPPINSEADMLRPELLLVDDGRLSVRYCPFDWVNPAAKVVIVGITPGLHQMFLSCQAAQRALVEGLTGDDVLRRACEIGSFAGVMRTNLVAMLDGIGLQRSLGIETTGTLFTEHADLLHSTSALLYPVFLRGKNYSGYPDPADEPILRAFIDQVFVAELAMVSEAVIIPLGKTVARILRREADRGAISEDRCLFDFPHPSGGNGHRVRQYSQYHTAMTAQVEQWG